MHHRKYASTPRQACFVDSTRTPGLTPIPNLNKNAMLEMASVGDDSTSYSNMMMLQVSAYKNDAGLQMGRWDGAIRKGTAEQYGLSSAVFEHQGDLDNLNKSLNFEMPPHDSRNWLNQTGMTCNEMFKFSNKNSNLSGTDEQEVTKVEYEGVSRVSEGFQWWSQSKHAMSSSMTNHTGSDVFQIPASEHSINKSVHVPALPVFREDSKAEGPMKISRFSKESAFKQFASPSQSRLTSGSCGINDGSKGLQSHRVLDQDTISKLNAFSARLKAVKSPAVKRAPGFEFRQTPKTPRRSFNPLQTPGTKVSTPGGNATLIPDPDCFVSILEGRGTARGEVGIAALQLSNPVLILCQFSDSPTYPRTLTKLMAINPTEILIVGCTGLGKGDQRSKLMDEINIYLPNSNIIQIQRKYYDESKGLSQLQQIASPHSLSTDLQYQKKLYCLAATAALLKYLERTENLTFQKRSVKIEFQTAQHCTSIDPETAEHVELMQSLGDKKSGLSLFGCMNKCSTRGGVRLLRSNLFQPLTHKQKIEARLNTVEELIANPELYNGLKNILPKFQDLELILSLCAHQSKIRSTQLLDKKMDRMIVLKQVLECLIPLADILSGAKSSLLMEARNLFSQNAKNCDILLQMLHLVINENVVSSRNAASMRFARAMAIRPNTNGLLDLDRAAFCESIDDLECYAQKLDEESDFPVKLVWSTSRGFYLNIPIDKGRVINLQDLPESFRRVQRQKNSITFVTEYLLMKDQLIQNNLQEISLISDTILEELMSEVREYIWFLYQLSENLSLIDLLLSFATVSIAQDYCKPELGECIAVRSARHPILELTNCEIVSNDICTDEDNRLVILTGPNMSGKSTYLRQVVLITIMAQVGCFIPAEFGVISERNQC